MGDYKNITERMKGKETERGGKKSFKEGQIKGQDSSKKGSSIKVKFLEDNNNNK